MEWNGIEWNRMEWNGMEWNENGMEWNGMEWNGMEWMDGWMDGWNGLNGWMDGWIEWMEWNGMNGMEWNGMEWNGLSWGCVERLASFRRRSSLVNTLYVLDEPSIGLHPRDSRRLVEILHRLRANQNTVVVVVEHDPEIIPSDYIIDLGPKAGERAGGN